MDCYERPSASARTPMGEVKPWMRRAANEILIEPHQQERMADVIAAHAPPVDALVAALRVYRYADTAGVLAAYDAWASRENS